MSKINQYELQSYFKSLCSAFYIVYKQLKQLEREEDELEETAPHDELEFVNKLLRISEQEEYWQEYVTQKYSEEELREKKEELETALKEYEEKEKELSCKKTKWMNEYDYIRKAVSSAICTLNNENLTVIVSTKEEIMALMYFFREYDVSYYRVINTDERYLGSFPADEKKYQEFYKAYCLADDEEMKQVCRQYF